MANKKPVSYKQYDARWKYKPYQTAGETSNIMESGCGPTCAAMLIQTLTGKTYTPVDACNWSVSHGYKAAHQGTYYSYFKPQFKVFNIDCVQLLPSRIIRQPNHSIHDRVKQYLSEGYYIIALMGPGTWTKGGHFIVAWDWDSKVRINDPASAKAARQNGNPQTFRTEARNYWRIDARAYNGKTAADRSDIVREVQKGLNEKYNAGLSADGLWGPSSKKAFIRAVQTEINASYGGELTVDGIWGPASKKACPDVKMGDRGSMVWLLQAGLAMKGYRLDIDNSFGPATLAAVKAFQKDNGLVISGIAGEKTWTKLLS